MARRGTSRPMQLVDQGVVQDMSQRLRSSLLSACRLHAQHCCCQTREASGRSVFCDGQRIASPATARSGARPLVLCQSRPASFNAVQTPERMSFGKSRAKICAIRTSIGAFVADVFGEEEDDFTGLGPALPTKSLLPSCFVPPSLSCFASFFSSLFGAPCSVAFPPLVLPPPSSSCEQVRSDVTAGRRSHGHSARAGSSAETPAASASTTVCRATASVRQLTQCRPWHRCNLHAAHRGLLAEQRCGLRPGDAAPAIFAPPTMASVRDSDRKRLCPCRP